MNHKPSFSFHALRGMTTATLRVAQNAERFKECSPAERRNKQL